MDIFSLSYGACELQNTTGGNAALNGWWQQAATQGIAVAVSTGDNGSAACDDPGSLKAAVSGLAVSGFASTPYNIAVGGTDFDVLLTNFTGYVNPSNSANTFWRTALSYIPESTWNNSSQVNGKISANIPFLNSTGSSNIVAGSGGVSTCSTNSTTNSGMGTCTHGYAKPSWQRGPQVPADGARDLPDVSLMSGSGFDTAAWLVCTDRTGTAVGGVAVTADCSTQSNGQFYFGGYGGTSTAAPAFAGILAMVQQKTGSRLGQAAKDLYDLYNGAHASQIFHDTVVGNISVPCGVNTANCVQNAAGSYFLTGYDTTTGYDLATGLGSVDASALVAYWGSTSANATATVTVTPAVSAISVGDILKVTVSVAGSGSLATPTGTVNLSGGGYLSPVQTLSAGSYTFTVPANSLFGGSDTLTVSYSGDSVYAPGMGTAVVTVSKLTPTVTVQPNQASYSANIIVIVGVTVSGTGPTPTGLLQLTGPGYTSPACSLFAGVCTFDIPDNTLASATDTLTATYSGDPYYTAAVGTASIKVSYLIPTVTATPSATNISAASSLQVVAHVTGTGAAPSGYVQLIGGGWGSGMVLLSGGSYTFTIPPMTLNTGSDLFIMSYFGDSVYAATNATLTVVVTKLPAAVTVTPASTSMNSGQSLSVTVAVAGDGGITVRRGDVIGGRLYLGKNVDLAHNWQQHIHHSAQQPDRRSRDSHGQLHGRQLLQRRNRYQRHGHRYGIGLMVLRLQLRPRSPRVVRQARQSPSAPTTGYAGSVSLACVLATPPAGVVNAPSCSVSGGSPVALSSSAMSGRRP